MRGQWLGSLGVVLSMCAATVRAGGDGPWRPAARTSPIPIASTPAAAPHPAAVSLGTPVTAGKPTPVGNDPQLRSAGYDATKSGVGLGPVIRAQSGPPDVPPPGVPAVPGGGVGPAVPPVPTGPGGPPPVDPLCGPGCIDPMPPAAGGPWMDRARDWFGWCGDWNRTLFMSDHCFDNFASPVTAPAWFEDPRSLTEIRPIFIYQQGQKSSFFRDGSIEWFGAKMSLALTDNLSIVVHKLGGVSWQPGDGSNLAATSPIPDASGFSEVTIGPKFTFLRLQDSQTVGAVGVAFDIPTGPNTVKQDTESLSIRPYVSFAQAFGRSSFGTFNVMTTTAYSFGIGDRTDSFFQGLHLDYNVGNFNRLYPLVELNYTYYPNNGNGQFNGAPINQRMEGRDLFNLGSTTIKGHNDLTIAAGARYKFTEWAQVGSAAEFPLTGAGNLLGFRWTFDFILRY